MSHHGLGAPSWYSHVVTIWPCCTVRVQLCHWGPDVPSGSRCPIAIQPCCHVVTVWPCCAIVVRPCHEGPDVPSGSGCPTTVQMSLCDPSILSPSTPAMQLCSGHAAMIHPRPWHDNPAVTQLWSSHPAVPPRSSSCGPALQPTHAIAIQLCHHGFLQLWHGTGWVVPAPWWPPSPPIQLPPPWLHPHFLFARRPPHGTGTPPRAPSPPPSPDAGKGHPNCVHHPARTGEPWGAILGGWWPPAGWGLTLPSPPGKTRGETPKSRPKPKCSRYHREKQPGGEWR